MLAIELRFLAGRFHGTGWHNAHNEAVPEWPPSPWRVLRSLVHAAYATGIPAATVEPVLAKLRGLPRYRLPRAVDAHTRHYMPDTDDGNHKRAKVFDAFVAIDGGASDPQPVTMAWPVELSPSERDTLECLCASITYMGRAESWADMRVLDVGDDGRWDCWPDELDNQATATSLLALETEAEFAQRIERTPAPKKGLDVPRRIWDVLTFSGERYRTEGWSRVPGTRLARYIFRTSPFERAPVATPVRRRIAAPTVARFAICSRVLPRMEDAIFVCERLRIAAMAQSRDLCGDARPVFSGHTPLPSNHQHAMFLACCDDAGHADRGEIDHLLITARAGFAEDDVRALQRIRRLWASNGHALELILVGLGDCEAYGGLVSPRTATLAESRVWESVTPFVPVRHPKTVRGQPRDTIEEQIRTGCEQLLGVAPIEVTEIGQRSAWSRFRRRRPKGGGSRGPDRGHGARLVFAAPQRGPIAIGYGAHFGLGLFAAVAADP